MSSFNLSNLHVSMAGQNQSNIERSKFDGRVGDIERASVGMAEMVFANMLREVFAPEDFPDETGVMNHLFCEVMASHMATNDKSGLKGSIQKYIRDQYNHISSGGGHV